MVDGKDLTRYLSHPNVQLSSVELEKIKYNMYAVGLRPLLLQSTSRFLFGEGTVFTGWHPHVVATPGAFCLPKLAYAFTA